MCMVGEHLISNSNDGVFFNVYQLNEIIGNFFNEIVIRNYYIIDPK